MSLEIHQVDAFSARPFGGNPAAVCLLPKPRPARWMQNVAMEMNLSETAFLHRHEGGWRLRWFTPAVEVALCGHATLASAHVLWETGRLKKSEVGRFHTLSGLLTARRAGDEIELDFPSKPVEPATPPDGLMESLGVAPVFVGRSAYDYLVEVDSASTLRKLKPDFRSLASIPVRGIIVTARSDSPKYHFISRFFAPASGVNEDPVTGSAHCALGPYWAPKLGRSEFKAFQASARGGVLKVTVSGDRVLLQGSAVTVMKAELFC
jgi:PhzF family phenazine biosynthesis protein